MHCNTLIEPACRAAGHLLQTVTGAAAGGVLGGIALAVMAGVKWIVADTATWWVQIPSPVLAAEPAVTRIQQWLLPITAADSWVSMAASQAEAGETVHDLNAQIHTRSSMLIRWMPWPDCSTDRGRGTLSCFARSWTRRGPC